MFGISDNIGKVFIWTPFSSDKQLDEQKCFLYHLKLFTYSKLHPKISNSGVKLGYDTTMLAYVPAD
jgi:hypothetical protein